jgi:uncharacterized protein (DUF488 family)
VRLLTVGHGTLAPAELVGVLEGAGVTMVVDVRTYPGSRRHPHVARAALARWMPEAGISYEWEKALGGFRRPKPDSPHVALRHDGFRGYADYMETPDFAAALDRLVAIAGAAAGTTVMCSESVWWRCHRRLLADALVALRGVEVEHLFHDGRRAAHALSAAARVSEDGLVYDVGETRALDL